MSSRRMAHPGVVAPRAMSGMASLVASLGFRLLTTRGGYVQRTDEVPPVAPTMPTGPLPHATERLSLWNRVDLLSRI